MARLISEVEHTLPPPRDISSSSRQSNAVTLANGTGANPINVDGLHNSTHSHSHLAPPDISFRILEDLQAACSQLPEDIPVATRSDAFATISGDPTDGVQDAEEAWEDRWDKELNRVLGYGASVVDISRVIRRGILGLEGFCIWVEAVTRVGIDLCRMKDRIQRVLDAVDLL